MKYPVHMNSKEAQQIEYDVVSDDLKIYLTRMLRSKIQDPEESITLIRQNKVINWSRTISGKNIYVLESDADGDYHVADYAWHNGEIELVFRRLSTPQLAEYLAELVQNGYLAKDEINELLKKDGASFRLDRHHRNSDICIIILSMEDLESTETESETHPNIRVLVNRMERSLEADDCSGVLHASASIFETLAKIVVARPTVEDQTLKSFFERYRKDSNLPGEILDYILKVYEERNAVPLAAHGATSAPTLMKNQAIVLAEMTKAFVKIEYKLSIDK